MTKLQSGIPIWLVRSDSYKDSVRVAQWSTDENPAPAPSLYEWISFEDDSPPRAPVWMDQIKSTERYRAMAEYSWSIAFPASVWGVDKAVAGASYDNKKAGYARWAPGTVAVSSAVSKSGTSLSSGPSWPSRVSTQSRAHSVPCMNSTLQAPLLLTL